MDSAAVHRTQPLQLLDSGSLSPLIQIYRGRYLRSIPAHYRGSPFAREAVDVNVILVPGGRLVAPRGGKATFLPFYEELRVSRPALFRRILSPGGTAKAAADNHGSPIKEITELKMAGMRLPGDGAEGGLYGWPALAAEAEVRGEELLVLFQGNGLYYNRGSAFFDGERLYDYPNAFLAELAAPTQLAAPTKLAKTNLTSEEAEQMAVDAGGRTAFSLGGESLKRPLLFFVARPGREMVAPSEMAAYFFEFLPEESYLEGTRRLEAELRHMGARAALAASPPLVTPGPGGEPVYLSLEDILSRFHANDVRHSLYCPYEGAVLLSPELGREQCLRPDRLARSLAGGPDERVWLALSETRKFLSPSELSRVLRGKGYAGRFSWAGSADRDPEALRISPLEGVYSHLVPILTRGGQFGILQTSGTRGTITGNDGPTFRQLTAILRDLNDQPPFDTDPIIAAASGSQGNDVQNVVCRAANGSANLLHDLAPAVRLDDHPAPRGMVTTPRVGIVVGKR